MAAERGQRRQRRIDPLITGIGDGVAAGYRAVESVVAGANESVRMRAAAPPAAAAARSTRPRKPKAKTAQHHTKTTAPPPAAPSLMGDIADVAADVLDGLGEAVREIAGHLAERDRVGDDALHHTLELEGAPGEKPTDEFLLSNTGPTALKGLTFATTNLIGAAKNPIRAGAVSLTPGGQGKTDRVRPGGAVTVTVAVQIPQRAPAGIYRGIVCAQFDAGDDHDEHEDGPVGAWAMIELEVLPTDPGAA